MEIEVITPQGYIDLIDRFGGIQNAINDNAFDTMFFYWVCRKYGKFPQLELTLDVDEPTIYQYCLDLPADKVYRLPILSTLVTPKSGKTTAGSSTDTIMSLTSAVTSKAPKVVCVNDCTYDHPYDATRVLAQLFMEPVMLKAAEVAGITNLDELYFIYSPLYIVAKGNCAHALAIPNLEIDDWNMLQEIMMCTCKTIMTAIDPTTAAETSETMFNKIYSDYVAWG